MRSKTTFNGAKGDDVMLDPHHGKAVRQVRLLESFVFREIQHQPPLWYQWIAKRFVGFLPLAGTKVIGSIRDIGAMIGLARGSPLWRRMLEYKSLMHKDVSTMMNIVV